MKFSQSEKLQNIIFFVPFYIGIVIFLAVIIYGKITYYVRVSEMKKRAVPITEALDKYKKDTGKYPITIEELNSLNLSTKEWKIRKTHTHQEVILQIHKGKGFIYSSNGKDFILKVNLGRTDLVIYGSTTTISMQRK